MAGRGPSSGHLILTPVFNFTKRDMRPEEVVQTGFELWPLWLQSITAQLPHVPHKFYFREWRTKLEHPLPTGPYTSISVRWDIISKSHLRSHPFQQTLWSLPSPPPPKINPGMLGEQGRACHPRKGAIINDKLQFNMN